MAYITGIILTLLGKVLAGELVAWSPKLADNLIVYSAKKVPNGLKERLTEEWHALLADTPGGFSKLMVAVSVLHGCARIRHEYRHPEIPYRPYSMMGLRVLDILITLPSALFLAPVLLLISLLIKLTSQGPAIVQVHKIDSLGYVSKAYCYRTFHMEQALNYKTTHFGKWLTRVRLDEVPELFAILRGDMSLIGSHPERVFYSPGVITISLDGPSFPSVAKAGLVGLSPEELTRFLQKPIPNYFKILPKALASLVIIRRIPLI